MSANQHLSRRCPAIMNDPRVLSNWQPTRVITDNMARANGFDPTNLNSNEFRKFLQQNGSAIRAQESAFLKQNYACPRPVPKIHIVKPYAV